MKLNSHHGHFVAASCLSLNQTSRKDVAHHTTRHLWSMMASFFLWRNDCIFLEHAILPFQCPDSCLEHIHLLLSSDTQFLYNLKNTPSSYCQLTGATSVSCHLNSP